MNYNISSRLALPAVGFGLMFFSGCLAGCILGSDIAGILTIAALVVTLASMIFRRGRVWAVGLLLGLAGITGYFRLYALPLEQMSGSSQRTELRIVSTEAYSYGWSRSKAVCTLNGRPTVIILTGEHTAEIGDSIDAQILLERAENNTYNLSDGIVLYGEVQEIYSTNSNFSLLYYVNLLRDAAANNLDLIGGDEAELCKGLLLGKTSGFPLRLRRDITYSGVNYMTAVSGAHLTLCVMILTELFGRKRPRLTAGVSLTAAVLLAVFFGFSPSVMRAGIMLVICRAEVLFSRRADTMNSLCIALVLLTIFTPNAAADPALQMSALGVFGTAVLGRAVCGLRRFGFERFRLLALIKQAAVMSLCAVVCIAPVSISLFGGISLAEIPASVVLSPFFTAAVALGLPAMFGLPWLMIPLRAVMSCFRGILAFFGELDWVWLALDSPFAVLMTVFTALALLIAAFSPERSKQGMQVFGLCLVLTLCVGIEGSGSRSRIDFISDGNSGAAVISGRNQSAVIISGNAKDLSYTLYDRLLRSGCTEIIMINAPQLDYDGLCGLDEITELFPAKMLLCPEELLTLASHTCGGVEEFRPAAETLSVAGRTIACAPAGEPVNADIALYYGYTGEVPESGAGLSAYVSSRQELLPEGGVNIYRQQYRIELDNE